jgi:hypothetical protein
MGISDIAAIEKISIKKILSVLTGSRHLIQPKQQYCIYNAVVFARPEP